MLTKTCPDGLPKMILQPGLHLTVGIPFRKTYVEKTCLPLGMGKQGHPHVPLCIQGLNTISGQQTDTRHECYWAGKTKHSGRESHPAQLHEADAGQSSWEGRRGCGSCRSQSGRTQTACSCLRRLKPPNIAPYESHEGVGNPIHHWIPIGRP